MLNEQTFHKLNQMKLFGLVRALQNQLDTSEFDALSFDERFSMLIDSEWTDRQARRLTRRLQQAKLREQACLEDIDYRHRKGLNKAMVARLATGDWVQQAHNLIVLGPTGVGKTFVSCALAQNVCRQGKTALYRRVPRFLDELSLARADGSLARLLTKIAKTDLLVLDDWGLAPLEDQQRRDLLEVIDDRYGNRSTILASQLPIDHWHEIIGDPTIADAICDRLVHAAHVITLQGESIRKRNAKNTKEKDVKNL